MSVLTAEQSRLVEAAVEHQFRVLARVMARRLRVNPDDMLDALYGELVTSVRLYDPSKQSERGSFAAYAKPGVLGALIDCAAKIRKENAWKVAAGYFSSDAATDSVDEDRANFPMEDAPPPHEIASCRIRDRVTAIITHLALQPRRFGGEDEAIEHIDRTRVLAALDGALATLTKAEQRLVTMLYCEGATLPQVGVELGVHARTIQRMHNEVRQKLGKRLARA